MRKFLSLFAFVAFVLTFAACGGNTPEVTVLGKFSVGDGKQVYFAKGNLWFSTNLITKEEIWSFAFNQYSIIGNEPMPFARDLFPWNEINTSADFDDWTISTIMNGGGYTWRVLTADEWLYLFHERPNYLKLFGFGNIIMENGTDRFGLFILPDNWQLPKGTVFHSAEEKGVEWVVEEDETFKGYDYYKCSENPSKHNEYVVDETHPENDTWSVMQDAGMIFLPAAGVRYNSVYDGMAAYWSSTAAPDWFGSHACEGAYGLDFTYPIYINGTCLCPKGAGRQDFALPVRLVRDVK